MNLYSLLRDAPVEDRGVAVHDPLPPTAEPLVKGILWGFLFELVVFSLGLGGWLLARQQCAPLWRIAHFVRDGVLDANDPLADHQRHTSRNVIGQLSRKSQGQERLRRCVAIHVRFENN